MNEKELIEQLHKGNRLVYNGLFRDHYRTLCLFAQGYITKSDQAEDFVQEAFIKLWENLKDFKNISSIKSYLYVVVRNKCLNHIRDSRCIISNIEEQKQIFSEDFFFEKIIEEETHSQLFQMVEELPNRTKEVLKLSLQGLKQNEIAEELDISVHTIKGHKKLAYSIIRKGMKFLIVILH